uniref:Jacalin-type lectin domain-containing protein n=1 Tax=Varanus komodoensis TaxID=61221 RepID=A0A8D2J051_VARKO
MECAPQRGPPGAVVICFSAPEFLQPLSCSSHSGEYGGYGGNHFSHSGNQLDGPITAIRVLTNWNFIVGLQVRHCNQWSDYVGGRAGKLEEITLHLGESITQAYGKYGLHCIHKLVFITSQGRQFVFGRDHGYSFNAAPLCKDAVLHYVSGRAGRCIHALSFHWGSYTRRTCRPCVKDEAVRGTTGDH